MNAPLRLPDAFDGTDQQPAAEPQPLPEELRDDFRSLTTLGQRRLGRWGAGAAGGLWCWSLGVCAYGALTDAGAKPAAIVLAAVFATVGPIAVALGSYGAGVVVPHALSIPLLRD